MMRTRIVATIGPATSTQDALKNLAAAGMNVARLNGSHANLDWHRETIQLLRKTLPGTPVLLDIPGRKIRTAQLQTEPQFLIGDTIILTTDPSYIGTEKVPLTSTSLHEDLTVGDIILADDGTLRFTVTALKGNDIFCRTEVGGQLKSRKGINVPYVQLRGQKVTDRDHKMIEFAKKHRVDFIGISFVESAQHIEQIRSLIQDSWPRIVAKIENKGGLENMDEIIQAADAIMIDRGDLAVETNLERVAIFQKQILARAKQHAKPVIVATEMLHTMITNPHPTKAEITDITNAVLDGAAATMLSGETAIGAHPMIALTTMRTVANVAESLMQENLKSVSSGNEESIPEAMSQAINLLCRGLPITKIIAITVSGFAARTISAGAPQQPILAVSNDEMAARSFNLLAGVKGIYVDIPFLKGTTDHIAKCLKELWLRKEIHRDDVLLVTAVAYPRSGNRMNLIETHAVADLIETLHWH
ncbi:MAG: pyruvate kinase [Alphaproteobacteria bacterium]